MLFPTSSTAKTILLNVESYPIAPPAELLKHTKPEALPARLTEFYAAMITDANNPGHGMLHSLARQDKAGAIIRINATLRAVAVAVVAAIEAMKMTMADAGNTPASAPARLAYATAGAVREAPVKPYAAIMANKVAVQGKPNWYTVADGGETYLILGAARLKARFPDLEYALLWLEEFGESVKGVHGFDKDTGLWGFRASEAAILALPAGALEPKAPATPVAAAVESGVALMDPALPPM